MIRVSNLGLWEDPYSDVIVPSKNITMQGVDNYVLAKSGKHHEIMVPGLDYQFDGHVFEHPLLENGEKSNILSKILNKSHYADGGEKKISKLKEKGMSKSLNKKSLENDTQGVTMEDYISNQRNDFVSRLRENNMNAIADESFNEMADALYGLNDNKQQVAQNGTQKTVYIDNVPYYYEDSTSEPWYSVNDHYTARDENGNKVKIRKDLMTKVNAQGNPFLPYYQSLVGKRLNYAYYPHMISGKRRKGDPLFAEGKAVGIISNQPYTTKEDSARIVYSPQTGRSLTVPKGKFIKKDDEGDRHKMRADHNFVAPTDLISDDDKYVFEQEKDYTDDPFEPLRNLTGVRASEVSEIYGSDWFYNPNDGAYYSDYENNVGIPFSYGINGQVVFPYEQLLDQDKFMSIDETAPIQPYVVTPKSTQKENPVEEPTPGPVQDSLKNVIEQQQKEIEAMKKKSQQKSSSKKTETKSNDNGAGITDDGNFFQDGGESNYILGSTKDYSIGLPQKTTYFLDGINDLNSNMRTAGMSRIQINGPGIDNFSLGRFNMRNYTNDNNELDINAINNSDKFKKRGLRLGTDQSGQLQLFDKDGNIVDSTMNFKGRLPKGTAYAMTNMALNSVPVMADIVNNIRSPRETFSAENVFANIWGGDLGMYGINDGINQENRIG